MTEGTYEFECMRAELLGLEKPDEAEFLLNSERIKAEQEELRTDVANELESNSETLENAGGKLDELNSILMSTRVKLDRFKKTACGSLSNIFQRQSIDIPSTSEQIEEKIVTSEQNESLDSIPSKTMEKVPEVEMAKNASLDIDKKMSSHLDKLDCLIGKAEKAELTMTAQNKQMKKFLK